MCVLYKYVYIYLCFNSRGHVLSGSVVVDYGSTYTQRNICVVLGKSVCLCVRKRRSVSQPGSVECEWGR